jgi:hypothetical protein
MAIKTQKLTSILGNNICYRIISYSIGFQSFCVETYKLLIPLWLPFVADVVVGDKL